MEQQSGNITSGSAIKEPEATFRELTFGEKAVGITFNPGKLPDVENIKRLCAAAIDEMHNQREELKKQQAMGPQHPEQGEAIAQMTIAIRAIMDGQMWGVKAATWLLGK